jgi:hypothetical protein
MAKSNGGIIGALNPTSFGKCTVTSQTIASGTVTTQPGTRVAQYLVVAGGGGGAGNYTGGGGGAGGLRTNCSFSSLWSNSISNYSRCRWSRIFCILLEELELGF